MKLKKLPFNLTLFSICLGFLLLGLSQCQQKIYSSDKLPKTQIVIGRSGGVAANVIEFVFLKNGQVFKSEMIGNGSKKIEQVKNLGSTIGKDIFKKASMINLNQTLKQAEPGNMNYYITLPFGKNKSKTISWPDNASPPSGILEFYQFLLSKIS